MGTNNSLSSLGGGRTCLPCTEAKRQEARRLGAGSLWRALPLPDGAADRRYVNPKYPHAHPAAVPFEAAIARWAGGDRHSAP